jgi:hypothetical protein
MKTALILIFVFVVVSLSAQWSNLTNVNTPLCTAATAPDYEYNSYFHVYVSTPTSDGFIIAWTDTRSGVSRVYAQKVNSLGVAEWAANGIEVSATSSTQTAAVLVSDGADGAIIIWYDNRNTSIMTYAQRILANGNRAWSSDAQLTTSTGLSYGLNAVSDNAGGAIACWVDNGDIYANRVSDSGAVLWGANGVSICVSDGVQVEPAICTDGGNGAIIAWSDGRLRYGLTTKDIYCQKVSSSGVSAWTANGLPVCYASNDQTNPFIVSDNLGGAYIVWNDARNRSYDIYGQRVNNGECKWFYMFGSTPKYDSGIQISSSSAEEYWPSIAADGTNGVFVTYWYNGSSDDIFCKYLDVTDGSIDATCWVSNYTGNQTLPAIRSDGAGSAYITWTDTRSLNSDIYAMKINSSCQTLWTTDGMPICNQTSSQGKPFIEITGEGLIVFIWVDNRNSATSSSDIYMQAVTHEGTFPIANIFPISATGLYDFADEGISFDFSSIIGSGDLSVVSFPEAPAGLGANAASVWWRISEAASITGFSTTVAFSYAGSITGIDEASLLLFRNEGAGWVNYPDITLDMVNDILYANNVTGFSDWGMEGDGGTLPVALSSFTAVQDNQNNIVLNWVTGSETQVSGYNVLRANMNSAHAAIRINSSLIPAANTSQGAQYSYADSQLTGTDDYYYWLESCDLDGNSDLYGPVLISYSTPDDPETPPAIQTQTRMLQNSPNPFNPDTRISFQLSKDSECELDVYDTKGKHLWHKTITGNEGMNQHAWNGTDHAGKALPSGIYLIRLKTTDYQGSVKAVILK